MYDKLNLHVLDCGCQIIAGHKANILCVCDGQKGLKEQSGQTSNVVLPRAEHEGQQHKTFLIHFNYIKTSTTNFSLSKKIYFFKLEKENIFLCTYCIDFC